MSIQNLLNTNEFSQESEVLRSLQETNPLTCLAYDGDWGLNGWQIVTVTKYDPESECLMTDDSSCHPIDSIRLLYSPKQVDEAALEIAKLAMQTRLKEKREQKYPNSGWVHCSEAELVSLARNALNENKLIDAMNYLAFAVALGFDY